MAVLRQTATNSDTIRKTILVILAASVAIIFAATIFSPNDKVLNTPISVTITAGISASVGLIVAIKHKISGLYGKAYVALAAGLICWFAGEMIWTYDNVIAGSPPSTISIAEVPWLAIYAFFGYYVFKTYRFFGYAVSKHHLILVLSGVSILIAGTIYSVLNSLEGIMQSEPVLMVRLVYPMGYAVLIVPSVLLLLTLRHGLLTYTPWLFVSVALILIAGADILFSHVSLLETFDLSWIIFPLYNSGNLAFTAALIWYNKFGIYDRSKALQLFQHRFK